MRRIVVLLVLAAVAAGGCGSDDSESGTSDRAGDAATEADLDGRTFTSTAVTGHDIVEGTEITVTFTGDQLSASAGCNTLGGAFTIDANSRLILDGPLRSTMIGCEPDLAAQDQWLTTFLSDDPAVTLDGSQLSLRAGDVIIDLEDQSAGGGDAALADTRWTLETVVQNDAASTVPAGVGPPTFEIVEGFAEVSTGCNRGRASAALSGESTLFFGPLALTKMACEGDAAAVEAAVVSVIDGDVAYTIEGDQLTLTKGTTSLVYRA